MDFCRQFLTYQNDPCRRQFDQTTQAARAVAANIAEGSARHDTSVETQMRLLAVARASLSEVMDDFMFFIIDKGQTVWPNEDPRAYTIRDLRLDPTAYNRSMLTDVSRHILNQKSKFDEWLLSEDMLTQANAIIILCQRCVKMLRSMLEQNLEAFAQEGGFTENMTQIRLETKKRQSQQDGAPRCPICGEMMVLRTIKKGERSGLQFWGCLNYSQTRCEGTLPYRPTIT